MFFYRSFSSVIYKIGWVYDSKKSASVTIPQSNEKDEIELIETEHDLWLEFIH